jgi:hypothetical protein
MKYVVRCFLVWVAMICLTGLTEAQGAGVKKFPGETVTFAWNYVVADEANITGYKLYVGPSATGPFTFTGKTVATPSLRTTTNPASFGTGQVVSFYTIRAYFTGTAIPAMTVESVDSNAAEVDMNVKPATTLTAN